MTEITHISSIEQALEKGNLTEAEERLKMLEAESSDAASLFYLQGRLHLKRSEWSRAMGCFMRAEELAPEGPAKECLNMLEGIMSFYNKDMYNQ